MGVLRLMHRKNTCRLVRNWFVSLRLIFLKIVSALRACMKALKAHIRACIRDGKDPFVALVWHQLAAEEELVSFLCGELCERSPAPYVTLVDSILTTGKPLGLDALLDLKRALGQADDKLKDDEISVVRVRALLSTLIDAKPTVMARWTGSPAPATPSREKQCIK